MAISLIAAALFVTAAPTLAAPQVAGAQTGSSSWDVFDNPDLQGPAASWFPGQAGRGYGSNNYRYTYAIGGDANAVNTAVWNLGSRAGTQELQVFVPCEHSVATVRYEARGPGFTRQVAVNQANECGHTAWTSLGQFDFGGGAASVTLRDNNSDQHHDRDGFPRSGFGVDAIRARCVSGCNGMTMTVGQTGWQAFDNPDLHGPSEYWYAGQAGRGYGSNNYSYTYAIGGDANAVNTAVWNLGNRLGTQELQVFVPCEHSVATVRYEVRGPGFTREVAVNQANECGQRAWTSLGQFDFNGGAASVVLRDNNSDQHYKRVELWRSNFGVDAIRARCVSNCKTTTQITGTPAAPTNLQATFFNCAEHERGCVRFTWSPPSLADGSSYTGYEYVLSRAGRSWDESTQFTSHGLDNALWDTAYTFEIRAVNGSVMGPAARVSITTPGAPSQTTSDRISPANPRDYPHGEGCGGVDPWSFYAGQCTSYVAWRLNDAGIGFSNSYSNGRPRTDLPRRWHPGANAWLHIWSNAENWAGSASGVGIPVDQNPSRGSVAHWGQECNGKSCATDRVYGHVAYVESVSADGNQITISEMNFARPACHHRTRTLTRGQASWPDNFIHFEQANP
ncbi:CHAP domain-containing protein [Candidatus Poriferisodalis sp.]|uniref:golvesin C-terminal-like domain-containing protein n=1 Tax=Candidatus Poriferisodalis sp. TaxID=3101277 RepID=UPI003B5A2602